MVHRPRGPLCVDQVYGYSRGYGHWVLIHVSGDNFFYFGGGGEISSGILRRLGVISGEDSYFLGVNF